MVKTSKNEEFLVLKAIKSINFPKFINQDLHLFNGVIMDLFPNVDQENEAEASLAEVLNKAMLESSLVENSKFVSKMCEVYTTIELKHGLLIIGESMLGKSTALHVLAKALSYNSTVLTCRINQKVITLSQLYGALMQFL